MQRAWDTHPCITCSTCMGSVQDLSPVPPNKLNPVPALAGLGLLLHAAQIPYGLWQAPCAARIPDSLQHMLNPVCGEPIAPTTCQIQHWPWPVWDCITRSACSRTCTECDSCPKLAGASTVRGLQSETARAGTMGTESSMLWGSDRGREGGMFCGLNHLALHPPCKLIWPVRPHKF